MNYEVNPNCSNCKMAHICKIEDEQRTLCKYDVPNTPDNQTVFGHSWEEIQALQQKQQGIIAPLLKNWTSKHD